MTCMASTPCASCKGDEMKHYVYDTRCWFFKGWLHHTFVTLPGGRSWFSVTDDFGNAVEVNIYRAAHSLSH